jgi:hypothetical protein
MDFKCSINSFALVALTFELTVLLGVALEVKGLQLQDFQVSWLFHEELRLLYVGVRMTVETPGLNYLDREVTHSTGIFEKLMPANLLFGGILRLPTCSDLLHQSQGGFVRNVAITLNRLG